MNGDGHLDIVVSSLNFDWNINDFPSLIWLENDGASQFRPHAILYDPTNLATMDVGDLNRDGHPDLIVGGMHLPGPLGREARLTAVFATGRPPESEKSTADPGGGSAPAPKKTEFIPPSATPPIPPTSDRGR